MTSTEIRTQESTEQNADKRSESEKSAVRYARHGWPVLPGSSWNGRRYVIPGTLKVTDGVRPSVARNYATADSETVSRWWSTDSRLVPSVLLRSGETFNVVSVASELARFVIGTTEFRSHAGPVIYRPDKGCAYFLVRYGLPLSGTFGKPGEIIALPPGEWVAAPPTLLHPGVNVTWWCSPERSQWQPIELDILANSLTVACRHRKGLSRR